ncbi:glycoside hydrolase [Rhypophila sp. PSN 637]
MFSSSSLTLLLSSLLLLTQPVLAVWPAPQSFSQGNSSLYLSQTIYVTYNGKFLPYTHGYPPAQLSSKEIVQAGLSRTLSAIFSSDFVPWMLHKRGELDKFEPDLHRQHKWVKSLAITQTGKDTTQTFKPLDDTVDESYNLTISSQGEAKLTAVSSIGVLRGLETFKQLFFKHSGGPFWYTPYVPVKIEDKPDFPHRGVMIDTARSWLPVDDILRTIDALAMNKLNRLHIHVTDSQSWPLVIPSMPEVAKKGAYRPDWTYSPGDIDRIQKYGVHRGVEVYFEIDMPGHIGSLSLSHPELIVAYNEQPYHWWCAEPPCGAFKMNDTRVYAFLDKLWADLLPRLAPYSAYFHTGGDELNRNDSMLDEGIRSNKTEVLQPLLQKFIDTAHKHVRKAGLTPLVWEEIPTEWEIDIGKDVVVQSWLGGDAPFNLTKAGHKVIDSNYNFLYLDCGRGGWINNDNGEAFETFYPFNDWCGPTKSWRLIYSYNPRDGLPEDQAKLIIGGEVPVWSETIDSVTLDSIIWPRASAAGEVWWSGNKDPVTGQNRSQIEVAPRLAEMRERLVDFGVGASTVYMPFCTMHDAAECSYPMGLGYT